MARAGFMLQTNPHGIIFDPLSLLQSLEEVVLNRRYGATDLFSFAGEWHSFRHHGSFRSGNREELLERINSEIESAHRHLRKAKVLFVTFGTAAAYFHGESEIPVANCHRLPQSEFNEVLLDHSRIVAAWEKFFPVLKQFNPELNVVFTVSPVRYLRLGAIRNQLSKSNLLLAAHEICSKFPNSFYFPSYELLMDDLRDYRFYALDRAHPSGEASEYIWLKLMKSIAAENIIAVATSVRKDLRIFDHRPSDSSIFQSESHKLLHRASERLKSAGHPNPEILRNLFF